MRGNLYLITLFVVAFHGSPLQSWISQKVCTSEENQWSKNVWLVIELRYNMSQLKLVSGHFAPCLDRSDQKFDRSARKGILLQTEVTSLQVII